MYFLISLSFRRNQYIAYHQLVRWYWGYLGRKVRVPLPSCAVSLIRKTFPADSGSYTEFKIPQKIWVLSKIYYYVLPQPHPLLVGQIHCTRDGDAIIWSHTSQYCLGSSNTLGINSSTYSAKLLSIIFCVNISG